MGEISVRGLGKVRIAGDAPTPEEEQAIIEGLQGVAPDLGGKPVAPAATIQAATPPAPNVPALTRATGGFVTRPLMEAAGATIGSVPAFLAGTPTGPGAIATGLAGATLGAGAGSSAFDILNTLVRKFQGEDIPLVGREAESVEAFAEETSKAFEKPLKAAKEEFLFTGGALGLGPVFRAFKPLAGKALGLGGKAALADSAAAQNIPLGPIQATDSKAVKGVARVLGVFPFVGKPFKEGAKASGEAVTRRFGDILNELAPNATLNELGVDLTQAAGKRFKKFRRVTEALYGRFDDAAARVSNPAFVPTDDIVSVSKELTETASEGAIKLRSGGPLKRPITDPTATFVEQLADLPETLTVKQVRQLQRDLQEAMSKASADGFDISRLVKVKVGLESALNNPRIDLLSEAEASEVVSSLRRANGFYAETIKTFQTQTAGKFGRIDKRIFRAGPNQAGSVNADESFKAVFNAKSPGGLQDLRKLVGRATFQKSSRKFLEGAYAGALNTSNAKAIEFNADKFSDAIGLSSAEGRASLKAMLEGTGVTTKNIEKFLDVARAAGSFAVPDTSIFLQRRLTLGGVSALTGAGTLGIAASSSPLTAVVAVLMTKKAGKILMSPENLKAMTRVLDDTVPQQQRRALLLRTARQILAENEEDERRSPVLKD